MAARFSLKVGLLVNFLTIFSQFTSLTSIHFLKFAMALPNTLLFMSLKKVFLKLISGHFPFVGVYGPEEEVMVDRLKAHNVFPA